MNTVIKKVLIPLFLLSTTVVRAQLINIGISSVQGFQNQVTDGQIVNYTVTVHNYGPGPLIAGNMLLYTAVDTFVNGFHTVKIDSLYINLNTLLQDSDKVYPVTTQYSTGPGSAYKTGGNVIVIWPQAIGANNVQSYTDTVHINKPVGPQLATNGIQAEKQHLLALPNPAQERVFLTLEGDQNFIEQVRIYDLRGREMSCAILRNREVDLSGLPQGLYFVQAVLNNREIRTVRVVKE